MKYYIVYIEGDADDWIKAIFLDRAEAELYVQNIGSSYCKLCEHDRRHLNAWLDMMEDDLGPYNPSGNQDS